MSGIEWALVSIVIAGVPVVLAIAVIMLRKPK